MMEKERTMRKITETQMDEPPKAQLSEVHNPSPRRFISFPRVVLLE